MASGILLYPAMEARRILRVDGRQYQRLCALAHIQPQVHAYDHRVYTITHEQLHILIDLRDQVIVEPHEVLQLRAEVVRLTARLAALEAERPATVSPTRSAPDSTAPAKARPLPEGWVPAHRWLCEVLGLSASKARRWLVQYAHLREHGWWANGVEYALTPEQQAAFRRLAGVSDTSFVRRDD